MSANDKNQKNEIDQHVYSIEVYEDPNGRHPFWQWINNLNDKRTKERLLDRFDRVEMGNLGEHKPLGGKLLELKFRFGPGYRIYCSIRNQAIVLILAGSNKSDQQREIDKAREYLADYIQRNELGKK